MGRLTDARLRAWLREGKPIAGKADGDGLTFTISAAGRATWVLRYRYGGAAKSMTLGTYPGMSLAVARETARERRVELDQGEDPLSLREAKEAAIRGRKTFNDLADSYLAREGPALSENTLTDYTRYLAQDVRPSLGRKPLEDIRRGDIVDVLEKIMNRSRPTAGRVVSMYSTAGRVFHMLSVIFKHGLARGVIDLSPMLGLSSRAVLGKAPPKRKRVALDDDELRAVLAALPQLGIENALALRILLATCTRKSELLRARVEDVDLAAGRWTITEGNSKTKVSMVVPLAPTVVGWFQQLIEMARLVNSPWVLPSVAARNHASRSRLNTALRRLEAKTRRFNVHDLRSTARSHLSKLGVDVLVCERCLNHVIPGIVGVYDVGVADFWEQRKAALELWVRHLERLEQPLPSNVHPLRAA